MRALVPLLIACSIVAGPAAAAPISANSLPMEIRKFVVELNNECKSYGGQPGKSSGLIKFADLTGDGLVDYVADLNAYQCQGAASAMGAGQSGAAMSIFVGGPGNTAVKVYDGLVYGTTVDKTGPRPRLYLDIAGLDCGQKNAARVAFSDIKSCSRPLDWNPAKRTFVYAPLAQARQVQ
jgi:hypothetical protein